MKKEDMNGLPQQYLDEKEISKYKIKKQKKQLENQSLLQKTLDKNIEIGQAQQNWYKSPNVLIDKYFSDRIITPTEFAFYHIILRYTHGFQLQERAFSLSYLKKIGAFDRKFSLSAIDKLETLKLIETKKGDRNTSTIIKPLFKSIAPDEYSVKQNTDEGSRKKPPLNGKTGRKKPLEVVANSYSIKENYNKENIKDVKENEKSTFSEEEKTKQLPQPDFEIKFREIIQDFSRTNFGAPSKFEYSYMSQIGILCDWNLEILKKKLDAYLNGNIDFLRDKGFSLILLHHVWNDLVIVPSKAKSKGFNGVWGPEVNVEELRGKEGYTMMEDIKEEIG